MILFDATQFVGKPSPVLPGCKPLRIIYAQEIWTDGRWLAPPSETRVRQLAHQSHWSREPGEIVCFDIETLATDLWSGGTDDRKVEGALDELGQIADWMHDERPGLRLGYYGIMPTALPGNLDYRATEVQYATVRSQYGRNELGQFEAEGLADKVDVIFPSLYARYENTIEPWVERATRTIKASRIYGKQIYPFLWFWHHPAGPFAGQMVSPELWRAMLNTCLSLADGAVIWHWSNPLSQWDENAAWWQVTRQFIEGK